MGWPRIWSIEKVGKCTGDVCDLSYENDDCTADEFYINGIERGECKHLWPEAYSIPLKEEEAGEAEIRILVQSNNTGAGLHSLVVIR